MKCINGDCIGITQGSRMLFSDYMDDGKFPEAFANAPTVHVLIGLWDMDDEHNIRADISAEQITTKGFDVVFRTWGDARMGWMRVG